MAAPPTPVDVIMEDYPKPAQAGGDLPDFMLSDDPQFDRLKEYARNLPYRIESNAHMQRLLDFIIKRMVQCLRARSYDPGFLQWDSMLNYWKLLKYPIPKEKRIALVKMYYELCVTRAMPMGFVGNCIETLLWLVRSQKKLCLDDLRLPWRPIYTMLRDDLFLSRRQYEISALPSYMGSLAEACQRFFHPACTEEVLEEIIPYINGTSHDSLLATQYYLLSFLPLSHPQIYLPTLFRLWEPVNSKMYASRMINFLAKLAELHVDPTVSDPARIKDVPDDARRPCESRINWDKSDLASYGSWNGIFKDVGIFTDDQWNTLMCYTLSSMEISLADSGSLGTGGVTDMQASFEIDRLPSPSGRIHYLATIIVYSMHEDSPIAPPSGMATPFAPDPAESPFYPGARPLQTTFIAGSKALDSLIKFIVSTESFFHPSNSGSWTSNLSSFVRSISYEFNKRWYEEQKEGCKTPLERRLTTQMRKELVKCLRTVVLLGIFSTDGSVVGDILSCLKSLSIMEPALLLPSIIERAVPSLEGLTETRRTTAMIRALTSVGVAIISRNVHYGGAKNLMPILDLLVPGIDANDSNKTLCTTLFLFEVSHGIKFGDLTSPFQGEPTDDFSAPMSPRITQMPEITINGMESDVSELGSEDNHLSKDDEDSWIRQSTAGFADWIATFFRRVISLLETLPDEMPGDHASSSGNDADASVTDMVLELCEQICIHLSEPLFDLVLTLIYDYATTTVRINATRCMHALVECVAAANPSKTLAKFIPYCVRCISYELDHGASSIRTTSSSTALPADAALHWNIALLRGAISRGKILEHQEALLHVLKLLHERTFTKRGFTLTGKLLKKILTELTGTFTDVHRFVNPEVWADKSFNETHHHHWGKLMHSKDAQIEWHVPTTAEIDFALRIFSDIVDPALEELSRLLASPNLQDHVWRNDYCRHLNIVQYAFSGTPQFVQEYRDPQTLQHMYDSSDLIDEIPEFIATLEPLASGFPLHDPHDPRWIDMTRRKHQFAELLRNASVVLRSNGTESALDPTYLTIHSISTAMGSYGDSRQPYFNFLETYQSEKNMGRRYAKQKVWSRLTLATRACLYHTARLRWNSIDRVRDVLKDQLISELGEWSVSGFASVRSVAQSALKEIVSTYDGARRLVQPMLIGCLSRGTEDDRIKGALYTLNLSVFTRAIMTEPSVLPEFARALLSCQHNEKPSIQSCVSNLVENCLSSFPEPSSFVYQLEHSELNSALTGLEGVFKPITSNDLDVIRRGSSMTQARIRKHDACLDELTVTILDIASSPNIHWKYAMGSIRFLRTLIRKDKPINPRHLRYLLQKTYDDHEKMRYYAQRGVMKALRNFKRGALSHDTLALVVGHSNNPLKKSVEVQANYDFTLEYIQSSRRQISWDEAAKHPMLQDKPSSGWLTWSRNINLYLAPPRDHSPLVPWKDGDPGTLEVLRSIVVDKDYWLKLRNHLYEENGAASVSCDNISSIKSIFQILERECLPIAKPIIEELLAVIDHNKQRAAAEMIAGIIGGSKHWSLTAQEELWDWLVSLFPRMLGNNVRTDSLLLWTTFLEYVIGHKDPRRNQRLMDYLLTEFMQTDFNSDSFFQPLKISSFIDAIGSQLKWRFLPWIDDVLSKYWQELACDHDEIRTSISEMLELSVKIKSSPQPLEPRTEVLVRQCRTAPSSVDIMGIRKAPESSRVHDLAHKFPIWRQERLSGTKVLQSTYDKVGNMLCKWLILLLNDSPAVTFFDVVLPLMPELFRFCELNDNEELVKRASSLLTRMCAIAPPRGLLEPILDRIFDAIKNSSSWRVRLKALPLLHIWHFRQFPIISDEKLTQMLEVCCDCLDDEIIEVREMAATTLSGILRCSPRRSILQLKTRFVNTVESIQLPPRQKKEYPIMLRKLHGGILGICALIDSFPYTVEKWTPELLTDVLNRHTYDPVPVSTTVRACAANFKKTHQDTWHEDQLRFNDEQLSALSTLLTGSSYYA